MALGRRLRILVVGPARADPGGVAAYYNAVLPLLKLTSHDIHYLEIGSTRRAGGAFHPLVDQLRFRASLKQLLPDLVICNPSLDIKSFLRDGMIVRQARTFKVPVLVFFHGWEKAFELRVASKWRWYFNATYRRAQAFIVLASDYRQKLIDWEVTVPIHLASTAVADELMTGFTHEQTLAVRPRSAVLRILFLARLVHSKGIMESLAAFELLHGAGRRVSLTVAGQGSALAEVQRFAVERPQLARSLAVVGDVRGSRKHELFAGHDIYCFPSHTEGMPGSVLEAMAFGLPVVTTAVGGLRDFFEDGKMGCLLKTATAAEIASAINRLSTDDKLMREISCYNFDYAARQFLAPAVTRKFLDVLEGTCQRWEQDPQARVSALITGPSLNDPGGVSSYYNAVLPTLREALPTLRYLEIGSYHGSGGAFHPVADQLRFRSELRRHRPDVVICNPSLDLKSFLRDGLLVRRAAALGIPTLVFFRGWNKLFQQRVERSWRWYFNFTYGRASGFVVLASEFRDKLRDWGVSAPVYLGVTAVASELIGGFSIEDKWRARLASQPFRILFLARLERDKGILETLGAFSLLRRRGLNVSLTVAGDGDAMSRVRAFAASNSWLTDGLSIVGDVRGERKCHLLATHDVYCFPSYSEGMPNSVLEAMAFGLPVVTSLVGGLKDFFENNKMGRVLETISPESVAEALSLLAEDWSWLREMSEYSHHYAVAHFLAPASAQRLLLACRSVTAGIPVARIQR